MRKSDRMRKFLMRRLDSHKGPFIKDVRTKGGRGVSPKADIVREVAWIYFYRSSQNADKGGRGSKILNILRTSFMVPKGAFTKYIRAQLRNAFYSPQLTPIKKRPIIKSS